MWCKCHHWHTDHDTNGVCQRPKCRCSTFRPSRLVTGKDYCPVPRPVPEGAYFSPGVCMIDTYDVDFFKSKLAYAKEHRNLTVRKDLIWPKTYYILLGLLPTTGEDLELLLQFYKLSTTKGTDAIKVVQASHPDTFWEWKVTLTEDLEEG